MSKPAITVENLGKKYKIGLQKPGKQTFGEAMVAALAAPFRRLRRLGEHSNGDDTIWALKDVSFEVQPGEVVGIIGRNGAGKSTLLKILSRITEPTTGRAIIRGRVASLLEVGTGFHPELTGRENIYLNGAILGMKKAEIRRKFDEIVAFSEIEKFLDTPVKRYSSGMYVRLAFAVAAHLDPEILIVDEVLAVGDAEFQHKCLGKMHDVATGGRTVLFVSHNMAAIARLCQSAIQLSKGMIKLNGPSANVVADYLHSAAASGSLEAPIRTPHFVLLGLRINNSSQLAVSALARATISVTLSPQADYLDVGVHILVEDDDGLPLFGLDSRDFVTGISCRSGDDKTLVFDCDRLPLAPGVYRLRLWLKGDADKVVDEVSAAFRLEVLAGPIYGDRILSRQWHGVSVTSARVSVNEA